MKEKRGKVNYLQVNKAKVHKNMKNQIKNVYAQGTS